MNKIKDSSADEAARIKKDESSGSPKAAAETGGAAAAISGTGGAAGGEDSNEKLAMTRRNRHIDGTVTTFGACVMLSALGALAPQMTSLITANPALGISALALIALIGAAITTVGSIHAHASRHNKSITTLFQKSEAKQAPAASSEKRQT